MKQITDRVEELEVTVQKHLIEHTRFEKSLEENTQLTKELLTSVQEIVSLVRGAKGLRSFVIWAAPIIGAIMATYAWIKNH